MFSRNFGFNVKLASLAGALLLGVTSASATTIPMGTVSSAHLFTPTVNVAVNPSTYSTMGGSTIQVDATGGFLTCGMSMTCAKGGTGTLNGTISFSDTVGASLTETLNNLFVFSDGNGGSFTFSATSVQTNSFINNPGINSSFTLYLLGTTSDANLGYTATATSLTIQANSTGGSPYSSSATLAVPPAPVSVTPEPSSLVLLGTGILSVAGAARRRFKK